MLTGAVAEPVDADDEKTEKPAARLSGIAMVAALIVLVAFGVFVWFMISQTGATELAWTRLAWLFASVEAIAFGAAGALFGASIQRERAEKAEKSAEKNSEKAAKGEALAATLKADAPDAPAARPAVEGMGPAERTAASAVAARHAALARELFP